MTSSDLPTATVSEDAPRPAVRMLDVAAVFFLSFLTGAIGVGVGAAVGGTGSYAETCGSLIGLWAGLIPGTILISRIRGTGNLIEDFRVRFKFPSDLRGLAVGLACQFLLLPIIYVIIELLGSGDITKKLEEPAKDLTSNAHGPGFFFLAVLLVIGAPVVEEIFYRGMLLTSLERWKPGWPAIVITGVIFGAVHFDIYTLPGLAAFGIVLAWMAHRYERLGPTMLAHAAFNLVTVIALWHG
jgi:membrane protease YdiL (CAAX protease family)